MTTDERARLFELIRTRSFKRGKFVLASGAESELYFNLKPTMMHPEGALYAARGLLDLLAADGAEYVGGLEMGAVPLIGAAAAVGQAEGRPVKTFFVRKKPKDYGAQLQVEGLGPDETIAGKRTVIVDDVATTAGSIIKALEAARAAGAVVETAVVIVDREEGGAENLKAQGVTLKSLFRASEFLA